MFAEKAMDLIKELERDETRIPPYNEDCVKQVTEEMKSLFEQNQIDVQETVEGREGLYLTIHTRHAALERNKRCLLAYSKNRLDRLGALRWDTGSILPPQVKRNVSERELEWFHNYSSTLASYMRSLGDHGGIDLTLHTQPPKSLYIQVRCIDDYGEFETSEGFTVLLNKNSMHFLPRIDCEPLIRQGILEHVIS